jgi:hypothetical protein
LAETDLITVIAQDGEIGVLGPMPCTTVKLFSQCMHSAAPLVCCIGRNDALLRELSLCD